MAMGTVRCHQRKDGCVPLGDRLEGQFAPLRLGRPRVGAPEELDDILIGEGERGDYLLIEVVP